MQANQNLALPAGYQLQGYEIRKLLSAGGFSFVYIARDLENQSTVAIKEYLPNTLALRQEGVQVKIPSEEASTGFRFGLKCFFEEGRALANIEHKNIVRVLNFFRANDTVYMVMHYERGKSLQEHILSQDTAMAEIIIRRVFGELLNGLREVHTQKLLHLDIKPANIYIRLDGSPVLLDFGSARQALTNTPSTLPPSYTPGFAAPEQYGERKHLGPWSDVYSIGASMYACLMQSAPLAADIRLKKDLLPPAARIGKGVYSSHLLRLIDSCMALDHLERPQSLFALQKVLMEEQPNPAKAGWLHQFKAMFK
ncbi:serine/threonine protein kinase [Methylobacillus gramineus]|uniref:serine/threonine protein kinase n=1 Tax=Methylobacillus gramineus TaxID=755169 RepID=UPI001CFFED1F|nr:serine/threonine-protein kinase [Methylobacillus gramineus]MCB5185668.1 serine/threonine protein kinase [Methylobacillus gramineus]